MPSLPAVMNELMSYTDTPIRVVSLLASVSPAPQAVRPRPSTPAEADGRELGYQSHRCLSFFVEFRL